jgi:hypothetical protein
MLEKAAVAWLAAAFGGEELLMLPIPLAGDEKL